MVNKICSVTIWTDVLFFGERKTGEPGEELAEQGENQQQTQPAHIDQTRAALVRGESSHRVLRHPLSPILVREGGSAEYSLPNWSRKLSSVSTK